MPSRRWPTPSRCSRSPTCHRLPQTPLEIIGIVVNVKGAERAINTGGVTTLGFPYSISPGFLERNQHQTPEEAVDALETIGSLAYKAGLDIVAYISMAFGNPYGDPWSVDEVVAACDLLADSGFDSISLADTVGLATPELVGEVVAAVVPWPASSSASISMRAGPGSHQDHRRIPGRLPSLRLRHRRTRRLPLRAGRSGRQCAHRDALARLLRWAQLYPAPDLSLGLDATVPLRKSTRRETVAFLRLGLGSRRREDVARGTDCFS